MSKLRNCAPAYIMWSIGVLIALLAVVNGCGFTTHNLIAHRAMFHFKERFAGYNELLNKYPNAVLGGAPFPDYLYTCGSDHSDGEYAHWAPFQANASNYIRSKPKPWDEDTEKLVVFMMGVVSHYIAGTYK